MLLKNNSGKFSEIKHKSFKKEKNLQNLVENNMNTLFNFDFLATEYSLENFRFDSIAYDKENNSFIIFEYKKIQSDSLVDQGYAYLQTVLNRKADIVLLFNEKTNSSKIIKDFDWSNLRIYFISPKFTEYQLKATGFKNMPFRLFEINEYDNDIFVMNEIIGNKIKEDTLILNVNNEKQTSEIIVYTEEDLYSKCNDSTIDLYDIIKNRILQLADFRVEPKKVYIAFKVANKNILDIEFKKSSIIIFLNMVKGTLNDTIGKLEDVSKKGHHGNGDYKLIINNEDDVEYVVYLVKQVLSYHNFI